MAVKKSRKQRKRLKTMSDLRRFLANLINETASGITDPALAGKLGFLLNILRGVLSDSDLEARISRLEKEAIDNESKK